MVEFIFALVIMAFGSVVMIAIGVYQIKSIDPVGFYTGEKPLKKEQLTDVKAYNKKHGWMWITYGIAIISAFLISSFLGEIGSAVLLIGVIVGALPVMMWYHAKLKKEYMR